MRIKTISIFTIIILFFVCFKIKAEAKEVLPSWANREVKKAIIQYVEDVTNPASKNFILQEDRIAVFDNDGTVQVEKPFAFVDMFALLRIRDIANNNPDLLTQKYPEWENDSLIIELSKTSEDKLSEMLENMKYESLIKLFNLANTSESQLDIDLALNDYVYNFKHPRFNKSPSELLYKPMIELIEFFKKNGFKVFFVSGSTTDYLRQFSQDIGIDKNNVVGWTFNAKVKTDTDGKIYIYKIDPPVEPISVKEGKVVNIQRYIGKQPVVAVGNSSGDIAMLTYTKQNSLSSLCLILNHTDSEREYDYDFGDACHKAAKEQGWLTIDMKEDFLELF